MKKRATRVPFIRSGLGLLCAAALTACSGDVAPAPAQAAESDPHLNPMITLLEEGSPTFGLYAPSARQFGADADAPAKTGTERAAEVLGFEGSDFVFEGSMEGGVEAAMPTFVEFAEALRAGGANARTHPLVVKMDEIAPDYEQAGRDIATQLNAGVSGVMFVKVESADEARAGIAAMRFEENGGTRPHDVGNAPDYWGVSEDEYRAKADLWPLNPDGELVNWTIVESEEGLANVREIAAVPGIGVLWPGAGTLRRLFSTVDANGERVYDTERWEEAIQSVLSACKEFDIACGFPANASDIEMRMNQGFSVFVMGWGERGFETIDLGRQLSAH